MRENGLANLLSELLSRQVESGVHGTIDRGRLYQALTTGPKLSNSERKLLLLSPVARDDYQEVLQEINDELNARFRQLQVEREIYALAAETEEEKITIKGKHFTVTMFRRDNIGVPWIILVQLDKLFIQAINPMTRLRLVDSGGLEWLRGLPDFNGEISSSWDDSETDLLKRSRRFSLALEPVC